MSGRQAERSRLVAVLLSAFACPGAGQIYARHYIRGGLLVVATLAVIGAVTVRTWVSMMEHAMGMQPEELMAGAFALAHSILESESVFFGRAGYAFIALWVYGIADAAIARPRPSGGPADA